MQKVNDNCFDNKLLVKGSTNVIPKVTNSNEKSIVSKKIVVEPQFFNCIRKNSKLKCWNTFLCLITA